MGSDLTPEPHPSSPNNAAWTRVVAVGKKAAYGVRMHLWGAIIKSGN